MWDQRLFAMGSQKLFGGNDFQSSNPPILKRGLFVDFGLQNIFGFNLAPIGAEVFHLQPPAAMEMAQNCLQQNDCQSSIQHPLGKNSLGPTIVWPHCLGSQTILGVQNNVWVSQWSLLEYVWQGNSISKHSVVVLRRCGPPRTSTSDSLSPTLTNPGIYKIWREVPGSFGSFSFYTTIQRTSYTTSGARRRGICCGPLVQNGNDIVKKIRCEAPGIFNSLFVQTTKGLLYKIRHEAPGNREGLCVRNTKKTLYTIGREAAGIFKGLCVHTTKGILYEIRHEAPAKFVRALVCGIQRGTYTQSGAKRRGIPSSPFVQNANKIVYQIRCEAPWFFC